MRPLPRDPRPPAGDVPWTSTTFTTELLEWRGPAPFYWLRLPGHSAGYVRELAAEASYGWGAIPVTARIGDTEWETSLLPKDGGYLLPVKQSVRRAEGVGIGDLATVSMRVAPRGGRQANGTGRAC